MNMKRAIDIFRDYSDKEKISILLRLAHEIPILGRDAYEVGGDGLSSPSRLRLINEVQHRVTGFLVALMEKDTKRYPDDEFVKIILEHPDDKVLERQLQQTFERLMAELATAN